MLRLNGYQDWTSTVTVAGGSYTAVSGTLVPAAAPTNPVTTNPAPQPTKSGLSGLTVLAAVGICGALILLRKKE